MAKVPVSVSPDYLHPISTIREVSKRQHPISLFLHFSLPRFTKDTFLLLLLTLAELHLRQSTVMEHAKNIGFVGSVVCTSF